MPEPLVTPASLPPELGRALSEAAGRLDPFGGRVHYFTELGSTNDVAAQLARRGAEHGTTVIAETQTAGRGRHGRSWFSPPGAGLYVSIVFKTPAPRDGTLDGGVSTAFAPNLTLMVGVALTEAVRLVSGLPVEIKWPNDLVIQDRAARAPPGSSRKLAGILTEASAGGPTPDHVIVGFGLNLHTAAFPPELADVASSVETELGRSVDGVTLLVEAMASLASWHARFTAGELAPILDRWRALAPSVRGAVVRWQDAEGVREGITDGLDGDGALLVRVGGGIERIVGGELVWT